MDDNAEPFDAKELVANFVPAGIPETQLRSYL